MQASQPHNSKNPSLKKALGFSSLFVVAMGGVTSQGSFVAILNGAGTGGAPFFIAMLLAGVLTFCYAFSYLELSLMMPKAGGPGTYTTVASGHFLGIILVLCGYVAVAAFGGIIEFLLLDHILDSVFPGVFSHVGLLLLVILTFLNILGVNVFASVQNIIVFVLLAAALVIGTTGSFTGTIKGSESGIFWQQLSQTNGSVFTLTVLALWAFAGLEYVCPLIEEAKQPEKNLPKAMISAVFILMLVYGFIAFAGMRQPSSINLASSEVPHWLLVKTLFGNAGKIIIVVFAVTATSSTGNAAIAGVARMLYGMAHHHQLPPVFKKIHPRWNSPWFGLLFFGILIAIPLTIFNKAPGYLFVLIISAASLWLVAYIIAHINVMLLRKRYPDFNRPFKTPLYPLPQIIGIIGMAYAIWNNSPSLETARKVYLNAGLIIGIFAVYAFFWVRYKMKKRLFEAEPIEQAISD